MKNITVSEEWSSQLIFQFKQLERRSLKKIRASTGFKPVTSAIPVRCSTNWAMKPMSIAPVSRRSRVRIPLKPWFFSGFFFQLLKLENLLRWSFFTFFDHLICYKQYILCRSRKYPYPSHRRDSSKTPYSPGNSNPFCGKSTAYGYFLELPLFSFVSHFISFFNLSSISAL